ncbi:unnamed protein product [Aspergillus oryzae]|nr:unnamed protein product [Aspergillus oryzae]
MQELTITFHIARRFQLVTISDNTIGEDHYSVLVVPDREVFCVPGKDSYAMASHKKSEDPLVVKDRQEQECESSDSTIASENASEHRSPMGLIDEDGIETLNRIASQSSRRRSSVYPPNVPTRTSTLATISENDPAVDPQGPSFDLNKWLKMVLRESERQGREAHRTGIVFKNFTVSGTGAALQLQDTVSSMLSAPFRIGEMMKNRHSPPKRILNEFNGLLKSGELLLVLGRPGSGCSTFLKSLCGELHGLSMSKESVIHYDGTVSPMFADISTLEFAALARTPAQRIRDMSREEFAKHITQVVMAVFGLSHTYNTKVGNDFVRGVSGGERKRVSIAEMALAHSPLAAWDNSTRGLDSATALKFVEALRLFADLSGSAHAVAIYQASQSIYDIFNKVVVLYEGRQIYYGPAKDAKSYFERQGWECPQRQTTGDFLTSVTNPSERKARPGMENQVPRTAEDFEAYWRKSPEYQKLMSEISHYEQEHPLEEEGDALATFQQKKREIQAKHTRPQSPYLLSVPMQIKLNTKRAYQRVWNDISSTVSTVISQIIMALIIGSVFYGTPDATAGFTAKGATLFFAVLLNALIAMNEINSLYSQRPIVEKHNSYAFYHPATEAIAGVVSDIPVKFVIAVVFNLILYFLAGLHRSAGQFFLYLLVTFIVMFVMSAVFRTMAAITQTVSQAMGLADPIYYAFEMLIANEFHGRDFICSQFIPAYPNLSGNSFVCSSAGAKAGQRAISGDDYIQVNYQYSYGHVWRNFGILIAFLVGFMMIYFIATELNSSTSSTAEVLVFRRGHEPAYLRTDSKKPDAESAVELSAMKPTTESGEGDMSIIPPQKDIFTWRDVCYDIEIKGEPRRLLDHVSGWVKPGTLTALMGVSGAGKTTLLDVLAHRTSMGVITGDMFVNGRGLDQSFQRSTGYVQQQDLHLETATVRESLRFSALLRQPPNVSIQEKYDYVEDVIRMLKMEDFAEAVVGVPGQGLNVEQRKLLTIGVELAAKPKLLLFLDEPTSAILFQQFDQLLFLARGGKTVYFGPIGQNSNTLLNYFESNGARKCADDENPAEWMLEIVNAGTNSEGENWFDVWKRSSECQGVQTEIDRIHREQQSKTQASDKDNESWSKSEFAMPFWFQLYQVTYRVFQQYWRMPEYIASKWVLGILSGLFIGFSFFQAKSSLQGMQTIVYSLFMLCIRERPSKTYSWKAFLIANIIVEIPYQIMMGILTYACYYYAVVGVQDSERQGLVLLLCIQFFIYASTFAHMAIAAMPDTETASAIVVLLFAMSLTFCGVMQTPTALPGFWIFMYRVSPFTYWVSAMAATQLHDRVVQCSPSEMSIFDPPSGQTCGEYMSSFMSMAGGQLSNPNATSDCNYCSVAVADDFLSSVNIYWSERWRNFGLMWVYIVFNIFLATMLYYTFRVKKWNLSGLKERFSKKK